jgi:hypothetical protein
MKARSQIDDKGVIRLDRMIPGPTSEINLAAPYEAIISQGYPASGRLLDSPMDGGPDVDLPFPYLHCLARSRLADICQSEVFPQFIYFLVCLDPA